MEFGGSRGTAVTYYFNEHPLQSDFLVVVLSVALNVRTGRRFLERAEGRRGLHLISSMGAYLRVHNSNDGLWVHPPEIKHVNPLLYRSHAVCHFVWKRLTRRTVAKIKNGILS